MGVELEVRVPAWSESLRACFPHQGTRWSRRCIWSTLMRRTGYKGTVGGSVFAGDGADGAGYKSTMNMAVAADDSATMRRLYAQQDWSRLALAAERRTQQQPQDSEAWYFWGISELMQLKGGPDKLLRASLLGNAEAGLWLGILQEFSAHPPGTVPVSDFPSQIELARLRRSPY